MKTQYNPKLIYVFFYLCFLTFAVSSQTKTLQGTVYENHQVKTTLTSSTGIINVYLPDDMAQGDIISGTVVAEPEGETSKEKKRNFNKLIKQKLVLPDGNRIPLLLNEMGQIIFTLSNINIPIGETVSISLIAENGNQLSKAEITPLPALFENLPTGTGYQVAKKVITNNEPLVLFRPGNVTAGEKIWLSRFHSVSAADNIEEGVLLTPQVSSPRKSVFIFPETLSGTYNVYVETPDGQTERIDLINIADIQASIGKGNLMKGEVTDLTINIAGLEDCSFCPVQLELQNNTPSIIQLPEGNYQMITIDKLQNQNEKDYNFNETYCNVQQVVGEKPGNFSINSTLYAPPAAFENKLEPFAENITTQDEFDSAVSVLNEDIDNFLSSSLVDNQLTSYLQSIQNYIQTSKGQQNLAHAKSTLVNLTYPLTRFQAGKTFFGSLTHLDEIFPMVSVKNKVPQLVHPLHNYAGEFNSDKNELIVGIEPARQEELLSYLGVSALENGKYKISLFDGENWIQYTDVILINIKPGHPQRKQPAPPLPDDVLSKLGGKAIGTGLEAKSNTKDSLELGMPAKALPDSLNEKKKANTESAATELKEGMGKAGAAAGTGTRENEKSEIAKKGQLAKGVVDGSKKAGETAIGKANEATETGTRKNEKPATIESEKEDAEINKEVVVVTDPGRATDGTYFKDKKGKEYIFYKDAECHLARAGETFDCQEKLIWENEEVKSTGSYNKLVFMDWNECRKGTGFCTEMNQIYMIEYVYEDENCERMVDIIRSEKYICPLN